MMKGRMMKTRILILLFAVYMIQPQNSTLAAPTKDTQVIVYTSVDDVFARPVVSKFQEKTGIQVKLVPDTEETKSTGLLNRLMTEKIRPQADVFWSGDPVRAAILKQKGVSAPYHPSATKGLPQLYSDPEGYWTGFSARARVLLVNKTAFPKGEAPTSVMDLVNQKYKGKGCIANPLFGTTSMHAAALFQVLGAEKARQFFNSMTENGVKMVSSNGEVRRRVSGGDCAFGVTDTDDAQQAIREKKPVEIIYPDRGSMGTLIVPNAAVLIKNGPNPKTGKAFIDYLLSAEIETMLAESEAAQMPVRAGVKAPIHVRSLDSIQPMQVNYGKLAQELDELSRGFLKEWASWQK
ncbi:MAG: extracellular solute-binding protein [Bdellovibrionales bacterium]|nr:extracellular solute-binding protein [Bdellovibrionales bacterium]